MTLSINEAVKFSDLAYDFDQQSFALPNEMLAAGWKILTVTQPNDYPSGYMGFAVVRVVNGVAVDLVIAHQGTEFSGGEPDYNNFYCYSGAY